MAVKAPSEYLYNYLLVPSSEPDIRNELSGLKEVENTGPL